MIFFVHIGKTAGSTMNRHLAEHYPLGFGHCESFIHDPAQLRVRILGAAWMSGHVPLPLARRRLAPFGREVRYFTCVRRPAAQVRSHYNWLVEIFHKGPEFYAAHPLQIKVISEQVRETVANPSPAAVASDLRAHAGLFLNHQSRYFFGGDLAPLLAVLDAGTPFAAIPEVAAGIAGFEAIGDSGAVAALFGQILGRPPRGGVRVKENASRYHFDPELFESEEVRATLAVHNRLDELLYAHLTARMTGGLLVNRPAAGHPAAAAAPGSHG
jgi:hypothetical protein